LGLRVSLEDVIARIVSIVRMPAADVITYIE